ncbi:aminoglycoside phosphotransferase family protein [Psychrobacter sp. M13]|uniref:aminoglycoside phosphotransferase family protein n=1 Tax=Psychrobacter sp. M13 TaxID=3067275 RepID=UPI00273B47F4|nr:phosphotransferase [Psychrobacter sp. M13]WLP95383.1 phosphotransferase [Psychrobacter sp. M13]
MTNKPFSLDATASTADDNSAITCSRLQQLHSWLQKVFEQPYTLTSLPGDASARRYHRLQLVNENVDAGASRYMVMDSADEQDAMQQFIKVTKIMTPAINVPKLIAQDIEQGFLVLQDFGSVEFADLLPEATHKQVDKHYQLAMQTLIALQRLDTNVVKSEYQLPDYDTALLNREMDLFRDWFVPYIEVELDQNIWNALKAAVIKEILAQPQVVVHRDYHSRNLMQDQADNAQLGVIDFQDAVIGAYSYDLVSLVRDAYVEWPEPQVSQWIYDYWQLQQRANLPTAASAEQFEHDVNIMGVQRQLKVLGIFIRLFQRDGKSRYLANIPKVLDDLMFELEWLETQGSDELIVAIKPFNKWLIETVLPTCQSKFVQQYI